MAKDCIFCQIINKKSPAKIILENINFIAFENIYPVAKTHILIIPKKHFNSLNDLDDLEILAGLLNTAKKVAKKLNLKAYKLLFNVEKPYQEIFHLHLHLISGNIDKMKLASA